MKLPVPPGLSVPSVRQSRRNTPEKAREAGGCAHQSNALSRCDRPPCLQHVLPPINRLCATRWSGKTVSGAWYTVSQSTAFASTAPPISPRAKRSLPYTSACHLHNIAGPSSSSRPQKSRQPVLSALQTRRRVRELTRESQGLVFRLSALSRRALRDPSDLSRSYLSVDYIACTYALETDHEQRVQISV